MKRLLILGAGEMQLPIIEKAKKMGLYTIVADFNANAPGLVLADEKAIISTIDLDKVLELAQSRNIDGLLTTSDYPVNIVAKVGAVLKLNAMSISVAELCTNKYLQRDFFLKHNIKTPGFRLINSPENLDLITNFPSIIKPVDSSASRGVKKVNNLTELKSQYDIAVSYSKQAAVIVEDYIFGKEYSIESLTQDGITHIIAITEKLINGEEEGFFVEDTHIIPARITQEEKQLISDEVMQAIKLMKMDNCPAHSEVKINEKGAFIIEIACRLGGDYITSDLVPLSKGIDMLENLINISLGQEIDVKTKWNKVAAVQFLNHNNYNQCLKYIETKDNSIVRSEIKEYHNNNISNSMERMGYIILNTRSENEMSEILQNLNT